MDNRDSTETLIKFARRASAFDAFDDQQLTKRELAEALSVSRPTAHRIIESFLDTSVVRQSEQGYGLTRYGELVSDTVLAYRDELRTVTALEPLIESLPEDIEFDHRLFADAVITDATYDDPFRPMNRFIELFKNATQIKGFNKSFLEPMYVDVARERIDAGMDSAIIYEPSVLELVLEQYPAIAEDALSSENMRAWVHDDLPIALSIFEDRIGIGVHTESMGTPVSWIDTDDPEAIAWGEALFERYRDVATRIN